jgi:1-deoxy-D-xylulose-5-phosphate synthase
MTILDRIQSPDDLKELTRDDLRELSAEIRERLIEVCSRTGRAHRRWTWVSLS